MTVASNRLLTLELLNQSLAVALRPGRSGPSSSPLRRTESRMLNLSLETRVMFELENASPIDLRMALFKPRPPPETLLSWPEPTRTPFLKTSAFRSNLVDPSSLASSLVARSSSPPPLLKPTQMLARWTTLGVVVAVGDCVRVAVRVEVIDGVTVGVLVEVLVGVAEAASVGVIVGV